MRPVNRQSQAQFAPNLETMAEIALVVVGAVIGFLVNEALGRGVRVLDRRRAVGDPLIVHVETDPSVIWAGAPPWIGAGFLVPLDADLSSPPPHCPDWRNWVRAQGGVDEAVTQLRLTLTARREVLVVVDGLRVQVHKRSLAPTWRVITCAVGGADITPRRAEIQLSGFDPPTFSWMDEGGDPIVSPTFSVSASEAEMLHVWAWVDDEWVEWTAELLVLVDGQRKVIEISDEDRPFITSGSAGAISHHMWASGGGRWEPPLSG